MFTMSSIGTIPLSLKIGSPGSEGYGAISLHQHVIYGYFHGSMYNFLSHLYIKAQQQLDLVNQINVMAPFMAP
jgi:hypothetical protein